MKFLKIVKNSLFSAFADVQDVRLPRKIASGNQHKGFAFVEFGLVSEAKKAFKAMSTSTHLYGRRLVLEWSKT